jgi:RNA polymerase sigma factor (sigma-70 family)
MTTTDAEFVHWFRANAPLGNPAQCGAPQGRCTRIVSFVTCPACRAWMDSDEPDPADEADLFHLRASDGYTPVLTSAQDTTAGHDPASCAQCRDATAYATPADDEQPDAAVRRPAAGPPTEVFEFVYARYRRRITHLVFRMVGDWASAEDLAAELFATLWQDLSGRGLRLERPGQLYGFLAQRARWVVAGHYRASGGHRERPLAPREVTEDKCRIQARAAELAGNRPEDTVPARVDMWRALSRLPDKQRRVVVLRYYDDLGVDAVARVAGCGTSQVAVHTARGLNTLRAMAGQPAGDPVRRTAAARREVMRTAYQASIDAGTPCSKQELARRFGCSKSLAQALLAGISAPPRALVKDTVRAHLRTALANGIYPAGAVLPSVQAIAAELGVNSGNVVHVMRELAAEGLVVKRTGPGMGTHGRYHAPAPVPALVVDSCLVTGRIPAGADTFPAVRLEVAA